MDRLGTYAVMLGVVVLLATVAVAGPTSAQSAEECQEIEDRQVCIQDVSAPGSLVIGDEPGNLSVTVENMGSTNATSVVILYLERPNANESEQIELARPLLVGGESTTITQSLNASTEGTHRLQIGLIDEQTIERYDLSEVFTIEVRTEPEPGLGGPIDRTEIALAALVVSVLAIAGLGYYQLRS